MKWKIFFFDLAYICKYFPTIQEKKQQQQYFGKKEKNYVLKKWYIHNIKTTTITTRNNQSICIDFSTTCHRKYYIFMYENKHYRLYEKNIILYVFREVHLSGHHTAYF